MSAVMKTVVSTIKYWLTRPQIFCKIFNFRNTIFWIEKQLFCERTFVLGENDLFFGMCSSVLIPHPDVLWAYRFLKASIGIVWWYALPSNDGGCESKNNVYSMHFGKDVCLLKNFFFQYSQNIFHLVFTWNMYANSTFNVRTLFWCIFLDAHTIQTVLKVYYLEYLMLFR